MSGGLYGRGKAPERACRPLSLWPEADRRRWEQACAPASLLDEDQGARSDRRAITNRKAAKGYGRWLTHLAHHDATALTLEAADRITPDRVKAYIARLEVLGNSTATLLARLQELGEVARVMDPQKDWRFINAIASRIRGRHVPARSKQNLKLSDELLGLGLRLMDNAAGHTGWRAAALYRDGLMIALLALVPLRRLNLAGLRLHHSLMQDRSGWSICLPADETKTGAPLDLGLPEILLEPLQVYLRIHRPVLIARTGRWHRDAGEALWISSHGSPLTQIAIYDAIRNHTEAAFGTPINLHLFRDAGATTLAVDDPQHVRIAAPLLGHRTFSTTERHYIQATGIEAHRRFIATVHRRTE